MRYWQRLSDLLGGNIECQYSWLGELVFHFLKLKFLVWSPEPCSFGTEQLPHWLCQFSNIRLGMPRNLLRSDTDWDFHLLNGSGFLWVNTDAVRADDVAEKLD